MGLLDHPNVKIMMEAEGPGDADGLETVVHHTDKTIQEKILFILNLYEPLSPSMLQIGIGTSIPPSMWKPSYNALLRKGVIIERQETHETPTGRNNTYTFIELSPLIVPEQPGLSE